MMPGGSKSAAKKQSDPTPESSLEVYTPLATPPLIYRVIDETNSKESRTDNSELAIDLPHNPNKKPAP
jgi:hypothetical protein